MIVQFYSTCEGVICEYKNCKQEVDYIQMTEDTDEGYEKGKLRCERHQRV